MNNKPIINKPYTNDNLILKHVSSCHNRRTIASMLSLLKLEKDLKITSKMLTLQSGI